MSKPKLSILGIGADGIKGLSADNHSLVVAADYIIAPKRLADTLTNLAGEVHTWPVPFDPMFAKFNEWSGKNIVILATGDPLWHGVGSIIARKLSPDEYDVIPSPSAFSLACARLGWPMSSVQTLTLHGRSRPSSLIIPFIQPDVRLLALTSGSDTVHEVAGHLASKGYGNSQLHVLENMGAPEERKLSFCAKDIANETFSDFNTLAIDCIADNDAPLLPRNPGLPENAFKHDGQLTKREVRAATLAALAPTPGKLLWDVGAGCGSIAIEWMRTHLSNQSLAFENNSNRIELIKQNAEALGVPYLKIIEGTAPASLKNQPTSLTPDAIFIGGGITTPNLFETCWQALPQGGRLVANCVTTDGRQKLFQLQSERGGELVEIAISSLTRLGTKQTMRPALPVLQWRITK